MSLDREQIRRDAEAWIERTLVSSGGWEREVARLSESILALLAELEQAEKERDQAFDAGTETVRGETVCSVCGWNHDRDESAACEGCEAIRWDEYVVSIQARLAKVPALVEQVDRLLWDLHHDESTLERSIAETRSAVAAWKESE